jgi:hypothetical protein
MVGFRREMVSALERPRVVPRRKARREIPLRDFEPEGYRRASVDVVLFVMGIGCDCDCDCDWGWY